MSHRRSSPFPRIAIVAGLALAASFNLARAAAPPIVIGDNDLAIEGELGSFRASWKIQRPEVHLMLATLTLAAPEPAVPPAIEVKWKFPSVDLAGVWTSDIGKQNFDHQGFGVESRAVLRAPLTTATVSPSPAPTPCVRSKSAAESRRRMSICTLR